MEEEINKGLEEIDRKEVEWIKRGLKMKEEFVVGDGLGNSGDSKMDESVRVLKRKRIFEKLGEIERGKEVIDWWMIGKIESIGLGRIWMLKR